MATSLPLDLDSGLNALSVHSPIVNPTNSSIDPTSSLASTPQNALAALEHYKKKDTTKG